MGNVESGNGDPFGAVGSLKQRLQSLEETIQSIEAAHQDAQGDHFPEPSAADVFAYGARLICMPGVFVLTGPVIGEVTANSAVVLLEVDIASELGPTARVSCFVSLVDDACPRGRVVFSTALDLPSRRPRAFHIGGGVSNAIGPGRAYTVCFGGVCSEDARSRVGRFRTPSACFDASLNMIALSGDRPDRLAPGEPSLWRVLRERVAASRIGANNVSAPGSGEKTESERRSIDVVLHAGGQAWMADAFEDAWELLKRRVMEPVLCADGGWREAQEEAAERLREAVRRSWNLPDKHAVLSSVANIMVCGAADLHPEFEDHLARVSSMSRGDVSEGRTSTRAGGGGKGGARGLEKERCEARALHAAIRACRRVYGEYQGQLLWKAVLPGGLRGEDAQDLAEAFEAEETGVEDALTEARRAKRDVTVKQKKVAMAEEAFRRANASGSLRSEGGLRAAEERLDEIRKEAKAARANLAVLVRRDVPAGAAAAADRASQVVEGDGMETSVGLMCVLVLWVGGFLNIGGSIAFALLDTVWTRVTWDGRIKDHPRDDEGSGVAGAEAAPTAPPLISPGAWAVLELELSRDSELRLLVVVMRKALMEEVEASGFFGESRTSNVLGEERRLTVESGRETSPDTNKRGTGIHRGEREHLLELLFEWKAGEAWREVVVVCGAEGGQGGGVAMRSACEGEILDEKHPGCVIRQIVAGTITDTPRSDGRRPASRALSETTTAGGRFSFRPSPGGDEASESNDADSDINAETCAADLFEGGDERAPMSDSRAGTVTPERKLEGGRGGTGGVREEGNTNQEAAPGWNNRGGGAGGRDDRRASIQPATTRTAIDISTRRRQTHPVSADGERSFLRAFLDGGHSPASAVAAGFDPTASARGVAASVVAEAVTIKFVGATVVLGPVVGRVTQRSAVVLVEVGSTAPVGCVLTDGATGRQHRQVRLLFPRQPHAFFFETLEENRHYTIFLDGVRNAGSRTGAFTTLKAWPDRREPPALRAAISRHVKGGKKGVGKTPNDDGDDGNDGSGDGGPEASLCDVRLLFVSGTGLHAAGAPPPPEIGGEGSDDGGGGGNKIGRENDVEAGAASNSVVPAATDMWGVLGRELWRPWPQADVVVHTGSQIDLEAAVMEALPILSVAEAEEEGSEEREEAEEMAMERIRDAYRFQWSLPSARACLSCGSHLMVRGEADVALPQLYCLGQGVSSKPSAGGMDQRREKSWPLGVHVSAYARLALERLAAKAFSDYQRQLWDPLSVPLGLDMNDVGYARGGAGIDSIGADDAFLDEQVGEGGEWHFHVFGETVGLFALDVRQGSAGLQRDARAPLLSDKQWSSLARALTIEEIQAMVIVGDAPFVSDSILDARAKARHPSCAHLRRSWPFHGGELLRLLEMLVGWKAAGAVGGDPREVILIGGGLRYPLETIITDAVSSVTIAQTVCGPFVGTPPLDGVAFELTGRLSQSLSYRHTINDLRDRTGREGHRQAHGAQAAAGSGYKVMPPPPRPPGNLGSTEDRPDTKFRSPYYNDVTVREESNDDLYRSPSCVLVHCEARGVGATARFILRSRLVTRASWAAWCGRDGGSGTAATAADAGRPRGVPTWAATAGLEDGGSGAGGGGGDARVRAAEDDVLAALRAEGGPARVIAEALERILDVEEDEDEDEVLAVARGGTGDPTRRIFESLTWVYENDACAGVRTLCPTRPSPIVVRSLLKMAQQEAHGQAGSDKNNASLRRAEDAEDETQKPAASAADDRSKTDKSRKDVDGKRGGRARLAKRHAGGTGGDKEEGDAGRSQLPSWLFTHLPFYDNDSLAVFFCGVLMGSERLAASFD